MNWLLKRKGKEGNTAPMQKVTQQSQVFLTCGQPADLPTKIINKTWVLCWNTYMLEVATWPAVSEILSSSYLRSPDSLPFVPVSTEL